MYCESFILVGVIFIFIFLDFDFDILIIITLSSAKIIFFLISYTTTGAISLCFV